MYTHTFSGTVAVVSAAVHANRRGVRGAVSRGCERRCYSLQGSWGISPLGRGWEHSPFAMQHRRDSGMQQLVWCVIA